MSEDNLENLPSIEDLIVESELPSVEEFIEKEKDEVEEIIEEVDIEEEAIDDKISVESLGEILRLISDVRKDIPNIPEIKYYDKELKELSEHIWEVKRRIPEERIYDNEVEELSARIESLKQEIADIPEAKVYDQEISDLDDRIEILKESIPEIPEQKLYDLEIEAICEQIDKVRSEIPNLPEWVNEDSLPDLSWVGRTFSVIDDDFVKVKDQIQTVRDKITFEVKELTESLETKDFDRGVDVKNVQENLDDTKDELKEQIKKTSDKIYEELRESALKVWDHHKEFKDDDRKLKKSVLSKLNEARQNIEKKIAESYNKSYESNKTLKTYFEGLKEEIASLPEPKYYDNPIKDLKEGLSKLEKKREEHGLNITELYRIVEELKEIQSKYPSDTDPGRPITPDPKQKQGKDPLTATDQKFATLKDLAANYRLFVNRVEQQLYTIGGGGAGFLKDLDDVNISGLVNGDTIIWNSSTSKWDVGSVSSGSTTWIHDAVGIHTLSNVGIATTARSDSALYVEGTATITGDLNVTGDIVYDEVDGRNLNITGIATVGTLEVTNNATVGVITATQFVSDSTVLPFYPPVMTTTQRDAMTVTQGAMIFNSTSKKIEFYDGTSWNTLPGMSLGLTVALDG